MAQSLQNRIIIITGGSTGIGLACAKKYAAEGAHVVVMANDKPSLQECKEILGESHLTIFGNATSSNDVENAIKITLEKFGHINVIHNNVGTSAPSKPLHETSEEEWQNVFDVNLKGILLTTRFAIEALKKTKGCIINTSSLVGEIGQENHAAYSATKGAVNALTKSMAIDYAPFKIRVNAVAPAGVWTPMLREWQHAQKNPEQIKKYLDDIHLLGDCPEGDVIADACAFLASDNARFITGCILPVSGGAELGYRRTN